MSDFEQTFRRVARAYEISPGGPVAKAREQRKLYGLYKQATTGDIDQKLPSLFNIEDQLKYRAWKSNRGMPREQARRRFVDLAETLGYRDPGDVPVPWISEETWLREESWTTPNFDQQSPCINDPRPVTVRDFQRKLAPKLATADASEMSPRDTPEEHRQRLRDSPNTRVFHIYSPRWPICCERITTLVGFRGVDEDVAPVLPRVHIIEEFSDEEWARGAADEPDDPRSTEYDAEYLRDDLALYHCPNCGGVYLARHES